MKSTATPNEAIVEVGGDGGDGGVELHSDFLLSKSTNLPDPTIISLPLQILSCGRNALTFMNHSLVILQPRFSEQTHALDAAFYLILYPSSLQMRKKVPALVSIWTNVDLSEGFQEIHSHGATISPLCQFQNNDN